VKLIVLSYLPAYTLFHKIAILNKLTRDELPNWKILDQEKILTVTRFKPSPTYQNPMPPLKSFDYALKLIEGFAL